MKRSTYQFVKTGVVATLGIQFVGRYTWLFALHLLVAGVMATTGVLHLRRERRESHGQPKR